jgi:hypothetical protein
MREGNAFRMMSPTASMVADDAHGSIPPIRPNPSLRSVAFTSAGVAHLVKRAMTFLQTNLYLAEGIGCKCQGGVEPVTRRDACHLSDVGSDIDLLVAVSDWSTVLGVYCSGRTRTLTLFRKRAHGLDFVRYAA